MPGMFRLAALPLLVAVFALALSRNARSGPRCDDQTVAWTGRCAAEQRVDMAAVACPAGLVVIELRPKDAQSYPVELSRRAEAFRQVAGIGLSPIGQFPDWSSEPLPRRAALDALAACVAARPPESLVDAAPPPAARDQASAAPVFRLPWLLIAAVLTLMAGFLASRGSPPKPGKALVWTAAALGAVALCLLVRRALFPIQFLHQNGQGPLWIQFALEGNARPYGQGFPEIFHWIARGSARPDTALILGQEIGAALVPLGFFLGARALGLQPLLAAMMAAIIALDPVVVRMARSESYLATIFTLLSLAASALMVASSPGIRRSAVVRVLAFAGAGLLVAQAARVHPLGWVPAAPLPLILLLGRDPLRKRLLLSASAAAAIGAVVAVASLPGMVATMQGSLGQAFLPGISALLGTHLLGALRDIALASLLFATARTRPFAIPVLVIVVVAEAAATSMVLGEGSPLIDAAYVHCFLPVAAAAVALLLSHERLRPRWAAAILGLVVVVHVGFELRSMNIPTDAAEQAWCLQWRERLPANAEVAWLKRADKRVLELPLYGRSLPAATPFHPDNVPPFRGRGPRYYYRGSLCSTPEGAAHCASFEKAHRLQLIESRSLPAIASLRWLPLGEGPVEVQLFSVE